MSAYRFIAAERARLPGGADVSGPRGLTLGLLRLEPSSTVAASDRRPGAHPATQDPSRLQRHLRGAEDHRRVQGPRRTGLPQANRPADAGCTAAGQTPPTPAHDPPQGVHAPDARSRGQAVRPGCSRSCLRAADITYVATDQGWLHLAVVMDLHSRKVVGWSTTVACAPSCLSGPSRWPSPTAGRLEASCPPLQFHRNTVHVDGVRRAYPPGRHRAVDGRQRLGLRQRGRRELLRHDQTGERLCDERFLSPGHTPERRSQEWIEVFYNCRRRHSTLGYLSPVEFERTHATREHRRRVR